jgi:hypothetical protein
MLLFVLNKNIPKKEIIHIMALWDVKTTVTALKQLVFYIYKDPVLGKHFEKSIETKYMSIQNILIDVLPTEYYTYVQTIQCHINKLTVDLETFPFFFQAGVTKNLDKGESSNWVRYIFDKMVQDFYLDLMEDRKKPYGAFSKLLWLISNLQSSIIPVRDQLSIPVRKATNRKIYESIDPIISLILIIVIPEFKRYAGPLLGNDLPTALSIIDDLRGLINHANILQVSYLLYIVLREPDDLDDLLNGYKVLEDRLDELKSDTDVATNRKISGLQTKVNTLIKNLESRM